MQSEAAYLLFDDFSGLNLNASITGSSPVIGGVGTWTERTNPATDNYNVTTPCSIKTTTGLSSNQAIGGTSTYCVIQLSDTPGEIGFSFILADNTNKYTPTMANWATGLATATGMIHAQLANNNDPTIIDFGTHYFQGVPAGSTSGGIQPNNWNDVSSGFARLTFKPGRVYTFRCFLALPFVYQVLLDSAGNVVSEMLALLDSTVTNYDIEQYVGQWLFLQTFNSGITYTAVWARARTGVRQCVGGLDATPIGIRFPSSGRFTSLQVGNIPGNPQGGFSLGATATYGASLTATNANGYSGTFAYDSNGVMSLTDPIGVRLGFYLNGALWYQAAPNDYDTAVTLALTDLLDGIITSNPSGPINLTLPLASVLDGLPPSPSSPPAVNTCLNFSVINLSGSNVVTIAANTGWTLVGNMAIVANGSAGFRARRTGANAWSLYRLA